MSIAPQKARKIVSDYEAARRRRMEEAKALVQRMKERGLIKPASEIPPPPNKVAARRRPHRSARAESSAPSAPVPEFLPPKGGKPPRGSAHLAEMQARLRWKARKAGMRLVFPGEGGEQA